MLVWSKRPWNVRAVTYSLTICSTSSRLNPSVSNWSREPLFWLSKLMPGRNWGCLASYSLYGLFAPPIKLSLLVIWIFGDFIAGAMSKLEFITFFFETNSGFESYNNLSFFTGVNIFPIDSPLLGESLLINPGDWIISVNCEFSSDPIPFWND